MTQSGETDSRRVHAFPMMYAGALGVRVIAGGGGADLTLDQARELLAELQEVLNLDRSNTEEAP